MSRGWGSPGGHPPRAHRRSGGAHVTRRILDPGLLAELASVDTPTICNAIEAFKSLDGLRERVLGRASH
jgi:hypothetical protein